MSKKNRRTPVSVGFRAVASKPAKQGVGEKYTLQLLVGQFPLRSCLGCQHIITSIDVYTCTQSKDTVTLTHTECEGKASYKNICIHLTARRRMSTDYRYRSNMFTQLRQNC